MTDRHLARDDAGLEAALRSLSAEIDWPTATPMTADGATTAPDIATRVRARLVSRGPRPRRSWMFGGRPVRRGLVLALLALLGLAIVAGAVGLGLPGLRITLGEPPASVLPAPTDAVSPTASRPGSQMPSPSPTLPPIAGMRLLLGRQVALDQVEPETGIAVALPKDKRLGPPDSVWIDPAKGDQVAYVWKASADLPETLEPGVGLVLMRFDGANEQQFYDKAIHSGTTLERVRVHGHDGYWISGDPHFFFY
ncbi:MAG TPA: hypothetical protein VFN41_15360, partial [Candidatus Limnocylindrales bacterium]|nr:hypothetical protein [Candidatus Limnocylindrales bacterium]